MQKLNDVEADSSFSFLDVQSLWKDPSVPLKLEKIKIIETIKNSQNFDYESEDSNNDFESEPHARAHSHTPRKNATQESQILDNDMIFNQYLLSPVEFKSYMNSLVPHKSQIAQCLAPSSSNGSPEKDTIPRRDRLTLTDIKPRRKSEMTI